VILKARDLAVSIGSHPHLCRICTRLDLDLEPGARLAILGRNGAGKSTLLATLAGLRNADSGVVKLNGRTYADQGLAAAARLRGWLGQERGDPFASTVLETVLTGRHPHLGRWSWEAPADTEIARNALATMGLAGLEDRAIQTLSGGERQRAALATLLTQQPRLYLLDEPLAHLDLNHQIATLELLSRLARTESCALAMVLHDPNFALRYSDRALLLFGDGTHREGPTAAVLDAASLSRLYGHPLRRVDVPRLAHPIFVPE
jgi:iron complex transport system ATP-binding protein